MKRTDYGNWHPSGDNVEFAEASVCRYIEMLKFPHMSKLVQKEGTLDDSSLGSWLDMGTNSNSAPNQEERSGGLRILTAECNLNYTDGSPKLSITKEFFARIEKHLYLPKKFFRLLPTFQVRVLDFHSDAQKNLIQGLIFKIGFYHSNFYQLTVTHDRQANITYCFLISKIADFKTTPLFGRLQEHLVFCDRLLLLPILAVELEIESYHKRINSSDIKINEMEVTMGQHEYSDLPVGNPLELDFLATTRSLNHINKRLGVDTAGLGSLIIALERMFPLAKLESAQDVVGESKVGFLMDSCRSLLLDVEYEEKRTKMLVQAVYQFMAQKDSKVNIALAKSSAEMAAASRGDSAIMRTISIETKRDSSSMKTIAVLGIFFLPGTFIAALFAMPVFEWNSDGSPEVRAGFKYYWAVTIPLTALVLFCWAVAILLPWRAWLRKDEDRRYHGRDYDE